jgi:hypothetical protein
VVSHASWREVYGAILALSNLNLYSALSLDHSCLHTLRLSTKMKIPSGTDTPDGSIPGTNSTKPTGKQIGHSELIPGDQRESKPEGLFAGHQGTHLKPTQRTLLLRRGGCAVIAVMAAVIGILYLRFLWVSSPSPCETDPIIAIVGATGAGKSTFIQGLGGRDALGNLPGIGHRLESCEYLTSFRKCIG